MKLAADSADIGGQAVSRSSDASNLAVRVGSIAIALGISACAWADRSRGHADHAHRAPVYQRRAFEWMHGGGHHGGHWRSPPVSSGWFQRPYPYHLDYYRMRYGGSYAPYFGNLYGPPQVVTAPPYYGPYYGGYGYPNGLPYENAGPHNGAYGAANPYGPGNGGVIYEGPVLPTRPGDQPAAPPENNSLPAPSP